MENKVSLAVLALEVLEGQDSSNFLLLGETAYQCNGIAYQMGIRLKKSYDERSVRQCLPEICRLAREKGLYIAKYRVKHLPERKRINRNSDNEENQRIIAIKIAGLNDGLYIENDVKLHNKIIDGHRQTIKDTIKISRAKGLLGEDKLKELGE